MSDDRRAHADLNLTDAAARLGLADPRPALRDRLRMLKERDPDAFARALLHYEEVVLPAISVAGDVMEGWVQYGATVAAMTASGRIVQVDHSGRAVTYSAPVAANALILYIPDDNAAPALVIIAPAVSTPAQQATLDLLVNGSLALK